MIRITQKEAMKCKDVKIVLTEDGLEYYRKEEPLYVVKYWKNENESVKKAFKRLADAERWGSNKLNTYDINCYYDKSDRYWKKQYQYVNGMLIGVDEQ